MSVTSEHRTSRPGGRTAKVRAAVLEATTEELVEQGFHGLNMERVATRAGVGKTTLYRRWGTPAGLAADLLADLADRSVTRPDTGSIEGNLAAHTEAVLGALNDPRFGAVMRALIAAATCDERTAAALHEFHARRNAEWSSNVAAAVERGELPAGTDPAAVTRAAAGGLYYRAIVTGEPIDETVAAQAVRAVLAAARAGAYA
ncbi:TetR/AcrR family transcriptional regulator [Saccharopolyspora sp. 5N102]|uniref:TetR/AcrR family transcriptional regulator n=1 Tax=Saccharopolyspora sp. 5N102 TaxID=3375155 RepID=UPI0037A6A35D